MIFRSAVERISYASPDSPSTRSYRQKKGSYGSRVMQDHQLAF